MRLAVSHDYAASPDRVHAMLIDPAFLARAGEALGVADADVQASSDAASVTATVPTPDAVRRFLGATMMVRQEFAWDTPAPDGGRAGTLTLTIADAPVRLVGPIRLAPTASGTRFDVDADLTVAIPLLGPTLEKSTAPQIGDLLRAQAAQGDSWLAAH